MVIRIIGQRSQIVTDLELAARTDDAQQRRLVVGVDDLDNAEDLEHLTDRGVGGRMLQGAGVTHHLHTGTGHQARGISEDEIALGDRVLQRLPARQQSRTLDRRVHQQVDAGRTADAHVPLATTHGPRLGRGQYEPREQK